MTTQRTAAASPIGLAVAAVLATATPVVADAQTACSPHVANWRFFDAPGMTDSVTTGTLPVAINDFDEVAGLLSTIGANHGFLRPPSGVIETFAASNGASETFVSGINDRGQIVGSYSEGFAGTSRGFIRRAQGAFTTVEDPAASQVQTYLNGINNWAVAVGTWYAANGISQGFVRHTDGSVTNVAGTSTLLYINDLGVALGWPSTGASPLLLKPNGTRVIWGPPPGTRDLQLTGLNIEGSVAFDAAYGPATAELRAGFVRHANGSFTTITPSASKEDNITLGSINNRGTVVGNEYNFGAGVQRGFAQLTNGTRVAVNAPVAGQRGTLPTAINNHDVMTGYYFGADLLYHGFVATLVTCN